MVGQPGSRGTVREREIFKETVFELVAEDVVSVLRETGRLENMTVREVAECITNVKEIMDKGVDGWTDLVECCIDHYEQETGVTYKGG